MKLKSSIRYQLVSNRITVSIYYLIILAIYIFFTTVTVFAGEGNMSSMGSTMVFIFVLGVTTFRETTEMMLQNGVSRKTMFIAHLFTGAIISAFMAVIDRILLLASRGILDSLNEQVNVRGASTNTMFEALYSTQNSNAAIQMFKEVCFDFFLTFAFFAIGYFIAIMFYRLNKLGKTLVGAGAPSILFIILPIINWAFPHLRIAENIINFIDSAFGLSAGNPAMGMLTFTIIFVMFSAFAWLLLRRLALRK